MKNFLRLICILCALLSLNACAPSQRALLPQLALLSPASLGRTVYAQQQLQAEFNGQSWQMQGALEVTPQSLRMVGLTPFGQRLITLLWDGQKLQEERDAHLPQSVQGERILSDVQLMYWPLPALRAVLPPGWHVEQTGGVRRLFDAERALINIECTTADPWQGRCVFEHQIDGYRLTLDSQLETP